jgi:predicted nucleotidyltransferase
VKPTPYAELNAVLQELVTRVQSALGSDFVGAYLQGSFAIGDFDQHSDVDFIIAIRDELANDHVTTLQAIHERIFELGISHESWSARFALRMRLSMSAMGSVSMRSHQLDLVMPGMAPSCARSRRQIRQRPNFRYTARGRPQRRQRV